MTLRATLRLLACLLLALSAQWTAAADIALFDRDTKADVWSFNNGAEFPGAKGSVRIVEDGARDGSAALLLQGDFTGGGNYVQITRPVPKVALQTLSFWVKAPKSQVVTVRLIDEGGTCHQLKIGITESDDWQLVNFPAGDFFENMGEGAAKGMVKGYEHWGKSKDQHWKGGLTLIAVLLGKGVDVKPEIWFADMRVTGQPLLKGAPVAKSLPLDEVLKAGEVDWGFTNGQEFKGATGGVELLQDAAAPNGYVLRMNADFTGGGAYVAMSKAMPATEVEKVSRIVLTLRSTTVSTLTVRVVDASDQTHQRKDIKLKADGEWHEVVLEPAKFAGSEHWGGAKDGKWHAPLKSVTLAIANRDKEQKVHALDLASASADVQIAVLMVPPSYEEGFEGEAPLSAWETRGTVRLAAGKVFAGKQAMELVRPLAQVNEPCDAVGPSFPAKVGTWELSGAARAAVDSADTSYHGAVSVEFLDRAGKSLLMKRISENPGTTPWKPFKARAEAPTGTAAARFRVSLEKTWGEFAVDALQASFLEVAAGAVKRLTRVMAKPGKIGGIFLPGEAPTYTVSVWAPQPLTPEELTATAQVTDYWGAEVGEPQTVTLTKAGFQDKNFQYAGELVLTAPLQVGRYNRLHIDVPQAGGAAFRHSVGVAVLPEPSTKQYEPESVPFSIRNWDGRIKDYFFLTERLGFRMLGVWGGWSEKAPYKAHLPGVDDIEKLGMKWITGTPAAQVERGKTYTDEMLREGMTNFLKEYANRGLAYIALGNEPHGGAEQIAKNIAAYKVEYEAVKAFDPSIQVIATSVEPNEEYFRQGYYNYCDAYDFHVYESYRSVRKTIEHYQEIMKRYNAVKPIFSTELGLNAQGMSRQAISTEMLKKFAVFFAAGGAHVSWFTIMYPDKDGTQANSSGQAFCVYDTRYNLYTPKLDAVTLYHAVNGIGNKTFRAEQTYSNGTETYLLANDAGECAQLIWNEEGRTDIGLPLAGATNLRVVQIDGSTLPMTLRDGLVSLSVSPEPLMLLYTAPTPILAASLAPASLELAGPVPQTVKGQSRELLVRGPGLLPADVRLDVPMGWTVATRAAGTDTVACTITSRMDTDAHQGRLLLQRLTDGQPTAAIVVEMPVANSFTASLRPLPGALELTLANHSDTAADLRWEATIDAQFEMAAGNFKLSDPQPVTAFFGDAADGSVHLAAGANTVIRLPLRDFAPQTLYKVTLQAKDEAGHASADSRYIAGLAVARRASPTIDGVLDEAAWTAATPAFINDARQFYPMKKTATWDGPADLSADIRYLWDDTYLYLGVRVTDDVRVATQADGRLWNMDGLQILVDPSRTLREKGGYYDYSIGAGTKGPQMWCHSTAQATSPQGEVTDAHVAVTPLADGGGAVYEVAIPWTRLGPFKPAVGADLGMSLIINDDDGDDNGRSFNGWFSGVHSKQLDLLGDILLVE